MSFVVLFFNNIYFRIAKQLSYTKTSLTPVQMRIDIPGGLSYEAFSSVGKAYHTYLNTGYMYMYVYLKFMINTLECIDKTCKICIDNGY